MEFEVEIEGTSPIIFNKPCGKEEGKRIIGLPDNEQAEYRVYRTNGRNSNIAIFNAWLKGCIRDYYTRTAPSKKKTEYYNDISPSISISPMYIDLGVNSYNIRKVPIMIKQKGKVANIEEPAQPILNTPWKAKFNLECTLNKPKEEINRLVELAGKYVGIGSNIINGYGRFKVTSFTKI